ncbi:hypothetical protein VCHC65A1_03312B, partial [Vibrio cholerae HC-65A1]
PGPATIGR